MIDLTKAVGFQVLSPADAAVILVAITPIRAWVTYGVAIVGFFTQRKLITAIDGPVPEGSDAPPKKKYVKKDPSPAVAIFCCGFLTKICESVDGFLERNLETLKDGGKAAMTRQVTRTLKASPSKKDTTVELKANKDTAVELKA